MNIDAIIIDLLPWLVAIGLIYSDARLGIGMPHLAMRRHAYVVRGAALLLFMIWVAATESIGLGLWGVVALVSTVAIGVKKYRS